MELTNKKSFLSILGDFFKEVFVKPLKLIVHPISGWDDFKVEKDYKISVALFYMVMMIIASIISQNLKGYIVDGGIGEEFKLFRTILTVLLPIISGTVASWCVGSLIDGKGKMKEIFCAINYSLAPFVWLSIIATIISNFITSDETLYYTFLMGLGITLLVYMMFFGIMGVHQNGLGRNVIHILLSIIVIAIIIFVVLLFFSFIERIIGWITSIINEIRMRYF